MAGLERLAREAMFFREALPLMRQVDELQRRIKACKTAQLRVNNPFNRAWVVWGYHTEDMERKVPVLARQIQDLRERYLDPEVRRIV